MDMLPPDWPYLLTMLILLGGVAGFMAGLLGIGGGIILVPGLYFVFKTLGYDTSVLMHVCVGTSLAVIIPTGISSSLAHYKKGAVRMDLVKRIGGGVVIGVIAGTVLAHYLSGDSMTLVFAVALFIFAGLMQIKPKQKPGVDAQAAYGPKQPYASIGGLIIGVLSSLMGIGGATLNVPFMTLSGVAIHQAVASSSAMGPLIALPGTIGFILIGWNEPGLPPYSLGYVNLIALALITPSSVFMAPFGAKVAHKISVVALRRVFAIFIVIVAIKMLLEAVRG